MPEQLNPEQPRILDTFEQPDGKVRFTIDAEASSADVFATLGFIEPDADMQQRCKDALLMGAIEKHGRLDNCTIKLHDPAGDVPEIAEVMRTLRFRKRPTAADVWATFSAIYGEEDTPKQLNNLLAGMIDAGAFIGITVQANPNHEFAITDDVSIAEEMSRMTIEFGYGDDVDPS